MKTSNCPQCQSEVKFGLQRCTNCGTLIFWKNQGNTKVPVVRRDSLIFPQKAEVLFNAFGREKKDDSSPVVREYFPRERVVAIGMEGDYVSLETGGWAHYSRLALFGKLHRVMIVDPTSAGIQEVKVLDRPLWGPSPEECGIRTATIRVGDVVEVWETIPGWIRIEAGAGHWVSTFWVDPKDQLKLK